MHGRNHEKIVLFGVLLLHLLAITSVRHRVVGWASSVLVNACIALLGLLDM